MQKRIIKVLALITVSLLNYVFWVVPVSAVESVDTAWVRRYNGPANNYDVANAIAVDGSNNVYVTGYGYGSGTDLDYATIKYHPNGDVAPGWPQRYNGPGNSMDKAFAIAVDGSGNAYVTGNSWGGGTYHDYATIKYYPDGDTAWVRRYNGSANDYDWGRAIAVDGSGNAYVTGDSWGSGTDVDYATIKYYSNGHFAWVRRYNGPGNSYDYANAIVVDGSGNVYVTGTSWGSATGNDYTTIKYLPNGDVAPGWPQRYNGPGNSYDEAHTIAVDGSNNVYVTGWSVGSGTNGDYATIKYYPNGDTAWVRRYNGPGYLEDRASAIAVDGSGNVYVTGYSAQDSLWAYSYDYATIKYYPEGDTAWVRRYNGIANVKDYANSIVVDSLQNVYVTGRADVDSLEEGDYITIKYRPNGEVSWIKGYNGLGNGDDVSVAIAVDFQGNAYITGRSYGPGTHYDYATIKYIQYDSIPFAPPVCYESGDFLRSVFCADLDGDSDLDLAVANDAGISILKNDQDGSFQLDSNYAVAGIPYSVFCADLDGDDDLDLAGALYWDNKVFILKNKGDGRFDSSISYWAGWYLGPVFCADLDGDTDLDLAVADIGTGSVLIFKNNGDGTFQVDSNYAVGGGPSSIFCADLDGDADLDLAVANRQSGSVSILMNNGDGTFQVDSNYAVGGPSSIFCADLDGDTDLDLAVANYWDHNVSILKNNGDGSFQSADNYGTGYYPASVFCSDLNGDSYLDLLVANDYGWHTVSILKNNGDATFQTDVSYDVSLDPFSVFCADLDADGDFDLAVAGINGICILENLTQVSANQPPWAFDLVFPSETDTTLQVVNFDWRDAYDPNFGDQIRYDLYVSTWLEFESDTTIYSNLLVSRHTDTLGIGTYYWKVKAKDNWGAYTWSSETYSFFNNDYTSGPLFVIAFSPVDLIVTNPIGDSIGIDFNTIPDATYDTTTDWNGDLDNDDIVTIPDPLIGTYLIRVIPEPDDSGTYDLGIKIDGGDIDLIVSGHPTPSGGEVDTFSYRFPSTDVQTEEEKDSPRKFTLSQNYPNPFNLTTQIEFTLFKPGFVSLKIYDLLGRKTQTLVSQYLSSGHKSVVWDGKDDSGKEVASGIYFYQLKVGDFRETKKLVLLK